MLVNLICSGFANALETNRATESTDTLSHHPTWLRLLHYEPASTSSGYASQVDDRSFFLADGGNVNPELELQATLAAFYRTASDANASAVCRFPARWLFLQHTLGLSPAPLAIEDCPELSQWLDILQPYSVSLVFASAYLNSPSSMFGHTFLRIDPKDVEEGSTWLSYAVNFGAELNADDNSILYAYKGLFGGYPGFFSVIRYYEKIKEYNRIENRDLWEYNLNLTPKETYHLVIHLWELRNIDFDYYFFDENCSYRLLELLEVARPGINLREAFSYRAIPIDTVRATIDAELVDSVRYRPSAAIKLEHKAQQLDKDLQKIAWRLAHQQLSLDDPQIQLLTPQQKSKVITLAYEHLRFLQLGSVRDAEVAAYSLQLLTAMSKLTASSERVSTPEFSPDQGHKTLLAGIAAGNHDDINYADLRLRLSYHDLLDNPAGYLDGAAINIGELKLRQRESDSLQIETLNFVEINSHSPRSLFFDPITWRVRAGFERIYGKGGDDLAAQVNGGAGVTYPFAQRSLGYVMAVARTEYNELTDDNLTLGGGALAGALLISSIGTMQIESSYYYFTDGSERYSSQLSFNLPIGRNNALRFSASHHSQLDTRIDEFNMEFRHYY